MVQIKEVFKNYFQFYKIEIQVITPQNLNAEICINNIKKERELHCSVLKSFFESFILYFICI